MKIPKFSAEQSLYKSAGYQAAAFGPAAPGSLRPQAARDMFGGLGGVGSRAIHWDCNVFGDCCARMGSKWRCCFGPPYNECIDV